MQIVDIDEKRDNIKPICPHCEQELATIYRIKDKPEGFFSGIRGYCYICPNCHKILGFADYAS